VLISFTAAGRPRGRPHDREAVTLTVRPPLESTDARTRYRLRAHDVQIPAEGTGHNQSCGLRSIVDLDEVDGLAGIRIDDDHLAIGR
jgi:hypothetical protein